MSAQAMGKVVSGTYQFEGFTLDGTRRALCRGERAVELRPKSFDVLCRLAEHAGTLVTRRDFFETVWPGIAVTDESLTRCVSDVRSALNDRAQQIVKTVPGRGYVLAVPVVRTSGESMDAPEEMPSPKDHSPPIRPSIAVLPFTNMNAQPDQAFWSDGITEDITAALCRLRGFLVIARNTMFTYKARPTDVRTLGRDLGVRYVLEGSVRKVGSRIRVTTQLLDAESGNHIWAERYDRDIDDIFAIHDDITASIVGRIGPELLAAENARISRKPPHSLDAWECVIRALFHSTLSLTSKGHVTTSG